MSPDLHKNNRFNGTRKYGGTIRQLQRGLKQILNKNIFIFRLFNLKNGKN